MLGFINGNVRPREESGNNDVHYIHLDLASLQSVREFAGEVWTLMSIIGPWMLPISILCLDFIVVFNFIKGARQISFDTHPGVQCRSLGADGQTSQDRRWFRGDMISVYLSDRTILLFAHPCHWIHFVKKCFDVNFENHAIALKRHKI